MSHLVCAVVPGQPRQSLPVQLSVSIPLKIMLTHLIANGFVVGVMCHVSLMSILETSGPTCSGVLKKVMNAHCSTQWFCCSCKTKPACASERFHYQLNWVWKLCCLNLCSAAWCPISMRCVSGCESVTHSEHITQSAQLSPSNHLDKTDFFKLLSLCLCLCPPNNPIIPLSGWTLGVVQRRKESCSQAFTLWQIFTVRTARRPWAGNT